MAKSKGKKKGCGCGESEDEKGDHSSQYGEFIPTYFQWISPEIQKERAEFLAELGKDTIPRFPNR